MTNRRTFLIAGATGNVGGGAAVALAKRGARIVLLGRRQEKLEAKAESIRQTLAEAEIEYQVPDIETLPIDFSDMQNVRIAAANALQRFPNIHGLILSVVTLVQGGPNILPNGHELMFATNVMGPFLFTELLVERIAQSDGIILHVINRSNRKLDWDDLESIENHNTNVAYERTKVLHRVMAGELARRHAGQIASVAFDPTFVIDKTDPELEKRWPSGFLGFFWKTLTVLFAKPPAVAGEPIADLMLSNRDRDAINGTMFKLGNRVERPDAAMNDKVLGERLWDKLVVLTGLEPALEK